jgi:hypothetical protein
MPGQSPPAQAPRQRFFGYLARVILSTLMSLAVVVAERRIRKALRSGDPAAATATYPR